MYKATTGCRQLWVPPASHICPLEKSSSSRIDKGTDLEHTESITPSKGGTLCAGSLWRNLGAWLVGPKWKWGGAESTQNWAPLFWAIGFLEYSKFPIYKPSSCELSKMRVPTCVPSTPGVCEIASRPPSPIADDPSALPSPTPPPTSRQ